MQTFHGCIVRNDTDTMIHWFSLTCMILSKGCPRDRVSRFVPKKFLLDRISTLSAGRVFGKITGMDEKMFAFVAAAAAAIGLVFYVVS